MTSGTSSVVFTPNKYELNLQATNNAYLGILPVKVTETVTVELCSWEGNRRSGVTLTMRHRLQWFIHLQSHRLRKVDEHPANTPHGVWYTLPLALICQTATLKRCLTEFAIFLYPQICDSLADAHCTQPTFFTLCCFLSSNCSIQGQTTVFAETL